MNLEFDFHDNNKFNYRVAAVITSRNHVLLQSEERLDFWVLPGGRCKFGESSAEAIKRELLEELKITFDNLQLIYSLENFFTLDGKRFHELSYIFQQELPKNTVCDDLEKTYRHKEMNGIEIIFKWFPLESVGDVSLYPIFLRESLVQGISGYKHIVWHDD